MEGNGRRTELGRFLRACRARLRPPDLGLPDTGRRRTPGLRRSEVAYLAGISVDWYTWLEQGRVGASDQVLMSIARALRLDRDETQHLCELARVSPPETGPLGPGPRLEDLQSFLDGLGPVPAYIYDERWDTIAWNRAALALFGETAFADRLSRNILWRLFTGSRQRYVGSKWEEYARDLLAQFRSTYRRHIGDPAFAELIEALQRVSPEFRALWPLQEVHSRRVIKGTVHRHPVLGELTMQLTKFDVADDPSLHLVVYTAEPGTGTEEKLARLLALDISESPAQRGGAVI